MSDPGEIRRARGVDGLDLAVRDWPAQRTGAGTILCLHGLTRNSRDFTALARVLGGRYRLIAPDQRGRGLSAYADPSTYVLPIQIQDTLGLLDQMQIERCVVVGTSMGALMAASMVALAPDRIAGVVLNDAGPVIDPAGLARIAAYVTETEQLDSWTAAIRRLQTLHGVAFPTYGEADWERFARWTYVWGEAGLKPDYDPRLREAVAATTGAMPDLWPVFEAVRAVPSVLLRGAHSDILSVATAEAVADRVGARWVTVPDRGHAPDLSEPDAVLAIMALLTDPRVERRLRSAYTEGEIPAASA
ncbi:MAG: alpha/beta hydrolase [Caulobacterales bacterium]|nr:alpha/beta hydrolase [Caulobacterales bacterium]